MSENNNTYTDDSFSLYQAHSYTLLIQVETTSFSYAVVHNNRLLASGVNCDLDELAHPKLLSDLLTASYKKVIVGLPATGLTLVPKSLFGEDHVADFARFLDVKDTEKVLAQLLDDQNVIVYKTNEALISAIEKFKLQNTVYTAEGWIKAIAKSSPPDSNLYLQVGKETVQFLYFSSYKLRFYNTFEFKNPDELVYFTAFVAEELGLRPSGTTLVVSGDISYGDVNLTRLTDFYPKIEINGLKVAELTGQTASHKLLALAALSLCGSSEVV
ncbi:DUF3822 family protein [Mucilaginibacter sp. X4EP1]|uniref:DUF3822 family protein n=1 Tax=Mucilaginibacter sp. X4EP1 TaxID=2723092 RepID=UPI00216AA1BF|nr:DUF3822 family protein [Mucilaginibacter sp. X4EP1]MCS3813365.1 hypothetical protein [Mucilaginibacter sp. X4EP1]